MVSSILKRAVAQHKNPPAPAVAVEQVAKTETVEPHRSDILKGLANIESWLRTEVAATKFDVSDKTAVDYLKKAARLNTARPQAGEPPDLNALTNKASTFFAYRAALRYDACQRATSSLRAYEKARKAKDEPAKKAAYRVMLEAAADLKMYPRDAQPGIPNSKHVALGLSDEKQKSAFKKDSAKGVTDRETSKLKAANGIQKIDDWRSKIFDRLVHVKSPWLTLAAVGALTGARPEELDGVTIERTKDGGLVFVIKGAKVSDTKGQPWRRITVKDSGKEFAHLWALAEKTFTVTVPPVRDYPDAYSVALARAGAFVFPKRAPRMSAYVYRHALASDLKADGFAAEQISATLGHSVTKTASYYGRAIGGKTGVRQLVAEVPRAIKMNHANPFATPTPPASNDDIQVFKTPNFDSLGM